MKQSTYVIDFDSTIIRSETLEELARLALKEKPAREAIMAEVQAITDQGMAGTLAFDKSLERRLQLFGAHRGLIPVLISHLKKDITPSVKRHKEWFRRNSSNVYVLSGAFEECVVPVVAELGIASNHVLANRFEYNQEGSIVSYDKTRPVGHLEGKVAQVAALHLPRPIIVVGDGYTDYEICEKGVADEFWAFCENVCRPSVASHADRILTSFDQVAVEVNEAA